MYIYIYIFIYIYLSITYIFIIYLYLYIYIYIASKVQMFKKRKDLPFFLFFNVNDSIYQFLKSTVCITSFKVNYSDTAQSSLSHCATYIRF